MKQERNTRKVAVITGASSGLGLAMARLFRQNGFYSIVLCRRKPESEVFDMHIKTDLANSESRADAVSLIRREDRLDILVNNAGIGAYAKWSEVAEPDFRNLVELDFFVPVLLTGELLPLLRSSKGTVVNISSVAGRIPVPCMGAYSAAKAALMMFSETLRTEEPDISVLTVYPGQLKTEFRKNASGTREVPDVLPRGGETPEKFAEQVFLAVQKKRRSIVYPFWYKLVLPFVSIFPRFYERNSRKAWNI